MARNTDFQAYSKFPLLNTNTNSKFYYCTRYIQLYHTFQYTEIDKMSPEIGVFYRLVFRTIRDAVKLYVCPWFKPEFCKISSELAPATARQL